MFSAMASRWVPSPTTSCSRGMATRAVREVVVMGGGLMGTGIAQVAAAAQQKVALVDLSQDILTKAEQRIGESLK